MNHFVDVILTMAEMDNIAAICRDSGIDLCGSRKIQTAIDCTYELEFDDGGWASIAFSRQGWIKAFDEDGGRVSLSELGFIEISSRAGSIN